MLGQSPKLWSFGACCQTNYQVSVSTPLRLTMCTMFAPRSEGRRIIVERDRRDRRRPLVHSNASERIVWRCRSPEAHAFEMTLSATDGVATFARNRDVIGVPSVGI